MKNENIQQDAAVSTLLHPMPGNLSVVARLFLCPDALPHCAKTQRKAIENGYAGETLVSRKIARTDTFVGA